MIIIRLKGGLGNQLFQYAFARFLSYNLNVELFLDVSYFNHYEKRKHVVFGLNSFNIIGMIGYYPYIEKTSIGLDYCNEKELNKYIEGNFPEHVIKYGIVNDVKDIKLPIFVEGYFQFQIKPDEGCIITENFFKNIIEVIHNDFEYIKPLSFNSKLLIEEMKDYDSIALHVRRGDYEKIPNFGLCSLEYYQKAIELLSTELNKPKFYIFTEDTTWAKENLVFNVPYKIIKFDENVNSVGRAYGELLKVFSSCEHFIIANSTFSWWGAFLSENNHKIIISPKPWFQDRSILETDTIDNIKTINLKNDYSEIYENSHMVLYDSNEDISFKYNGAEFLIKNIKPKSLNSTVIIKISLESNCFNGLKIYYKTENDLQFIEKNSLNLYYYNEILNHYLILPKDAQLDEIMISPYIMEKNENDYMVINSIKIKEI